MVTGTDIYNELIKKGYSKKTIHALLLKLVNADIKRQEAKQRKRPKQTAT